MPYCEWNDENWRSLIHTIRHGNCILMLGPGTSIEQGEERPCAEVFAERLFQRIKGSFSRWKVRPDISNVAQVAQYYSMEKDRISLESFATEFYSSRQHVTSELHQNLATLPFPFIITSTFDSMLYNALDAQNGNPPITEHYHFCGSNKDIVPEGTVQTPLIFKLFGDIQEPDSLVLTEDDFLDFLTMKQLPSNVTSRLTAKNKSILFLGFGFKHWYSRVLLHFLNIRPKKNRSFALEQQIPSNNDEFERTVFFLKESDYQIQFFKNDLQNFVKELKERFENFSNSQKSDSTHTLLEDAPTAFICHANEDKNKASEIYKKLEEAGIRAWLDQENLRGGDRWDREIERTIQKIDYFLVLQSNALGNKLIGYVNKEIKLALDRQLHFRELSFIIPLVIEECDALRDFAELQTVDLTGSDDCSALIQVIRRDWQRRKRNHL